MTETLDFLKKMVSVPGLSGYESPIREVIQEAWEPLTDELSISKLGSLHGLRKGRGPAPRKSILIATHMDAIGLIVTAVKDGFLHCTRVGYPDARVLPGQLVTVHTGDGDLPGVIILPPAHTLPKKANSGTVPVENLLIDIGLSPSQVANKVKIGDLISFATEPVEMKGDYFVSHYLDNRSSVTILTETLKQLQKRHHEWDVWAVATAQEEETLYGAATSGYQLRPTLGVVVDVTFASSPGTGSHEAWEMDKGPTLDWGPNTHPKLYKEFEKLAKKQEIPYQRSVYARSSGTDAILLQVAGEGIPVMVASIPIRYMHTPVEMLHTKDISRVARLLTEFITALDDDFMDKLEWHPAKEEEKESE